MRLVGIQRSAHGVDPACQIRSADRRDLPPQGVDFDDDRLADLDLRFGLLRIAAEQKVLFGAALLQEIDFEPVGRSEIVRARSAASRDTAIAASP